MGTINDGAMKNWENGDVVTEALYEADREMLRVAINDNFARLMKSITVLNADGSTKTTKNMDTAFNFLKVKDGTGITLSMDGVGTVTIAASPAAASVNTAALQDGSVLTVKLADGSVTTSKLATGSVTTDKIADGSVTNAKVGEASITTSKLADGSVTGAKLDPAIVSNSPQVEAHNADVNAHPSIRTSITDHTGNTSNPHNVTAAQIGAANILTQLKTVDGSGSGLAADQLATNDTRAVNSPPSFYNGKGMVLEFKTSSVLGIGSSSFTALMTFMPYADVTGNALAGYQEAHSEGKKWFRKAIDDATWGAWQDIINSTGGIMTGGLVANGLESTSGLISVHQLVPSAARYHCYNGGGTAEWKAGQKSGSDHDYKISKVVAGVESDYLSVTSDGNVTVPVGNLIYRGEVMPSIRNNGGVVEFWNGGAWLRLANSNAITLFSADTDWQLSDLVPNDYYAGSAYTSSSGGSGSMVDYSFFVDPALVAGRTVYLEVIMRKGGLNNPEVILATSQNAGIVASIISTSATNLVRLRSGPIAYTAIQNNTVFVSSNGSNSGSFIKLARLIIL